MATTSEECTMFLFSRIHSLFNKRASIILQFNFSVRCASIGAEAAPTLKGSASRRRRCSSLLKSSTAHCRGRGRWPAGHSCKRAPQRAFNLGGFSVFS